LDILIAFRDLLAEEGDLPGETSITRIVLLDLSQHVLDVFAVLRLHLLLASLDSLDFTAEFAVVKGRLVLLPGLSTVGGFLLWTFLGRS
jgi:hypothetical protein